MLHATRYTLHATRYTLLRRRIIACSASVFLNFSKCAFCATRYTLLRRRIIACSVVAATAAALFNCSKCLSLRT